MTLPYTSTLGEIDKNKKRSRSAAFSATRKEERKK